MNKQEVIRRLCKLATDVGNLKDGQYAHDCFCGEKATHEVHFQFSEFVLGFIENAVKDKIQSEVAKVETWHFGDSGT